jgi:hypothetical protein
VKTDELIRALAQGVNAGSSLERVLWLAFGTAIAAAVVALALVMKLPGDLGSSLQDGRFVLKLAVLLAVVATSFALFRRMAFPERLDRHVWLILLLGPAMLGAGIAFELLATPPAQWVAGALGHNGLVCLTIVPLVGLGPLAVLLWVQRFGAPTRPGWAGFCAGLLAGGIGAVLYGLNCPDNSPLFVLLWYPMAIGSVGLLGAIIGSRFLHW